MNQTLTRHSSTTAHRPADATVERAPRPAQRPVPVRHRPAGRPAAARPAGVVCADGRRHAPVSRRPAPIGWGAAIVAGIALAVAVWAVVLGGSAAAESSAAPVAGTSVVHVRGGESLGEIAARVAPDRATSAVVADIKELNHMSGSALTAGQPLLAPLYRD
ncbi:LysM peptidoglycan-binding domain-containing protein [Williamsia sp. M5A3_1d]